MINSPVSMVWNAVSTLVESRAEVSRNETPFFSAKQNIELIPSVTLGYTCLESLQHDQVAVNHHIR